MRRASGDPNERTDESNDRANEPTEPIPLTTRNRLITSEDPYHVHKTFGFLSVVNFLYRYLYVLPTTGTLGYETITTFNTATIVLHMLLSSSSIIFKVLTQRLVKKPLLIYKEYQLHTILFTARAIMPYAYDCVAFHWGYRRIDVLIADNPYIPFLAITAIHLMVDLVSQHHGTPGMTTVRCSNKTKRPVQTAIRRMFSFYQIVAMGSLFATTSRNVSNLGFNMLVAIQSSTFLMTLVRKNIIHPFTHLGIYGACLVASTFVISKSFDTMFWFLCMCVFGGRIMGISKYILWHGFHGYYFGIPLISPISLAADSTIGSIDSVERFRELFAVSM